MLVYIGIPCIDGKPYAAMVDSLLAEQLHGFKRGVHFLVDWEIGCSLIGHARNKIAARFLEFTASDTLMMIDADISWKGGELIRLAKRDEDVIGGTYRQKTEAEKFHVRGPVESEGALYRVTGIPGGFMKISRRALERIDARQYKTGPHETVYRDLFPTGIEDGTYWGEDYGFCRQWIACGGSVWLDPDIRLKHHDGGRYFTGSPREWLRGQNGTG